MTSPRYAAPSGQISSYWPDSGEGARAIDDLAGDERLSALPAPAEKETPRARCAGGERDLCTSARAVCAAAVAVSPRRTAGPVDLPGELESRAVGASLRSAELACSRAWEVDPWVESRWLSRTGLELVAPESALTPFCCCTPALGLAERWKFPVCWRSRNTRSVARSARLSIAADVVGGMSDLRGSPSPRCSCSGCAL